MAKLSVQAFLVNDSVCPDYEMSPQQLIDKLIGDDTGAPMLAATFTFHDDHGHRVTINIPVPKQSGTGPRVPATEMRIVVERTDQ